MFHLKPSSVLESPSPHQFLHRMISSHLHQETARRKWSMLERHQTIWWYHTSCLIGFIDENGIIFILVLENVTFNSKVQAPMILWILYQNCVIIMIWSMRRRPTVWREKYQLEISINEKCTNIYCVNNTKCIPGQKGCSVMHYCLR